MKYKQWVLIVLIFGVIIFFANVVMAQLEADTDRTLSPYFFVKSDDPKLDQLPVKSTRVKADVSGVIADVKVTQVYQNEGKRPLEAIYVFPGSTKAAVYGMKMIIGERHITAKIRKREDARNEYEQAKQAGKSASLLEQHRPNVFQMNVANILPGDVITVELKYTELLVPTDAVYQFVYPSVVGPRYSEQQASETEATDKWVENPYLHQGDSPTYTFDIIVNLAAGLPIQDLTCSSHQVHVNYAGPTLASLKLEDSERQGGNRDFVVKYRLSGDKIESGVLLFEGKTENFFLLMLQPPKRVKKFQIPPREYIFIVDVSGSMHGFPLDISKQLLKNLIGSLRPVDRFNVLLFAGGASMMSQQSLPATTQNIRRAVNVIERQRGGGGTRLLPALKEALSLPRAKGFSRSVVIATDGYVRVEKEAFELVRKNLGDANMFAFGIGASVNRYLIEGMARVGMGEPFVITSREEASEKARKFRELIQSPVLTGIEIDFGGFETYDVEPPGVPDVFANRPVIVFGKWRGASKGSILVSGMSGEFCYQKRIDLTRVTPMEINLALRYLWARHRIAILSDYNKLSPEVARIQEVTKLGLTYNLLTAYTSFVAIDTQIRVQDGQATTVKQPLPLPQGVSDYAVGNGTVARKMASHRAPSSTAMPLKGRVMEERREYTKDDRLACEPAISDPNLKRCHIRVEDIVVTAGLPKTSVQGVLKRNVGAFNLCCRETADKQSQPKVAKVELVFTLVVDSKGNVIKVKAGRGRKKLREIEKCLLQELMKLHFQASEGGSSEMVTITFVVK